MDYDMHKRIFGRNFAADFPTRTEWKKVLRGYDRVFFADKSKRVCEVDTKVASDTFSATTKKKRNDRKIKR